MHRAVAVRLPIACGVAGLVLGVAGAALGGSSRSGSLVLAGALVLLAVALVGVVRTRAGAARALADAERRSRTDPLTELFNRRHAMEAIEHELARGARDGRGIGLLMVDIDHFKRINDAHGHSVGDAVLVEVARRLRAGVREWDLVARIGGEEFCVIAPAMASEAAAAELGDQLRQAICDRAVTVTEGLALPVTISVGVTHARAADGSAERAVDCADRAVYAAKRRGRNRLCRYSDLDDGELGGEEPECLHVAEALARTSDMREGVPLRHSREVGELSAAVARRLGLSEDEVLRALLGGWLHDIGKVAVPDDILAKPGALTESEWNVMRRHPAVGEELLRNLPELWLGRAAVRHHHERYDGGGYPDGLAGERIPIEARIVSAVDAFAAMTAERPHQRRRDRSAAIAELRRCAGTQLDPVVVAAVVAELEAADAAAQPA
jgi:diguanylate cyclase (GGDEF)-like protein